MLRAKTNLLNFIFFFPLQQKCGSILKQMPKHPEDTPSSSVTGRNFSEKLRDIFIKGHLFYFHMEEVIRNQESLVRRPECISTISNTVKNRLRHLLLTIKPVFDCLKMGDLIQPDPPEFPKRDTFEKRKHGTVVTFRLKEWVEKVTQVLGGHVKQAHGC